MKGKRKGGENSKPASRLTKESLQELKDLGFRFVLVKGYTLDRRADYIELNHFTLVPVRELPQDPNEKEIYAPLDSEILQEWASDAESGVEAYIEP